MKKRSYGSFVVSVIISCILHLLLAALLFLFLAYRTSKDYSDLAAHESTTQRSVTTEVVMYTRLPQSSPIIPLGTPVVDDASESKDDHTLEQDVEQESIEVALPSIQEPELPSTVVANMHAPRIDERPVKPTGEVKRISKRKQAIKALQGLSLGSITKVQDASLLCGTQSDRADTHAMIRRAYASKVFDIAARAINTDGVVLALERDVICLTALYFKIARDGTLLDVFFDPCPDSIKIIEQEIAASVRNTGLYPRVPRSINGDCVLLPYPIKICGKAGSGSYKISYGPF